ncbi:MAG TPA: hypothetical protein PLW48_03765 [Alphaproteobacteria bacterium]|nr:hypothetical protein [Alphaproteobacteria bacterium]
MIAVPALLLKVWKWRNAIIPAMSLVAVAGMWLLADYRLMERDKAVAAREVAEASLKRATESALAVIQALEIDREESHERNDFFQNVRSGVAADRLTGRDGPLAPVLADTYDRLRARYASEKPD